MLQEHGLFTIEVDDNLFLAQFFHAWNYDQANSYNHEAKLASQSLIGSPWARIIDLTHWEGGGEEVVKPITDLHHWSQKHDCVLVVFVNPPILPKFMLDKYGDPYGNYQTFKTIEKAKAWVKKELINLSKK